MLDEGRRAKAFAVADPLSTAHDLLVATNGLLPYSLSPAEFGRRSKVAAARAEGDRRAIAGRAAAAVSVFRSHKRPGCDHETFSPTATDVLARTESLILVPRRDGGGGPTGRRDGGVRDPEVPGRRAHVKDLDREGNLPPRRSRRSR